MVDYQSISIIFAGLSIAASILYYASVLRNANKTQQMQLDTRQAQLFMQILIKWNELEFKQRAREILRWEWENYDDFKRKYIDDVENWTYFTTLGTFLEGIGILVYKKLMSAELVDNLFSAYIISYWEKYEEIEYEIRERYNVPQSGEFVEYLYKEIKELTLKQHPDLKDKESRSP